MAYHHKNQTPEEIEFYEILGDRIKMFRLANKMKLTDLAVELGTTSVSYVSKIERGKVMPSLYRIHQIAKALEVDILTLIPVI